MMLPTEQRNQLATIGWTPALDNVSKQPIGGHRVNGKQCWWFDGTINGQERSAWIADDGTVMLFGGPDMTFGEFIDLLTKPAAKPQRGLFDEECD